MRFKVDHSVLMAVPENRTKIDILVYPDGETTYDADYRSIFTYKLKPIKYQFAEFTKHSTELFAYREDLVKFFEKDGFQVLNTEIKMEIFSSGSGGTVYRYTAFVRDVPDDELFEDKVEGLFSE